MSEDLDGSWYDANIPLYEEIRPELEELINRMLQDEGWKKGIEHVLVDSRVKSRKSFLEKMSKMENGIRKYPNPRDITDLIGLRIVCYLLTNVEDLKPLIERYFEIDNCETKMPEDRLGEDKMGYRSINYIVQLRNESFSDPIYQKFNGNQFEIQIKTLLDFAWQEIEHDKAYKTSIEFSANSSIKRRFKLVSGLLEIADNEFNALSKEVETHDEILIDKIKNGKLEDLPISARSLRKYLREFENIPGFKPYFAVSQDVLNEIKDMGITTIGQLDKIVKDIQNFKERYTKVSKLNDFVTFTSILRDILIIHDAKKYTKLAHKPHYYNTFDCHFYKVHKEFGVKRNDLPPGIKYEEGCD